MSKKNIWCRMLGHRYQMALGGYRCARCGHFREAAWAKIPPPPKPPKPVEKRTDYEELWKNSKSVTDIFQSMRLALWGLSTDTCDVMYVGGKYIILDEPPLCFPNRRKSRSSDGHWPDSLRSFRNVSLRRKEHLMTICSTLVEIL
jgi:hypothetical protein